jgi:hypothetical protein
MPAPTSYSEQTLAAYMHRQLGDVAVDLGWEVGADDAGSYGDAVDEVALLLGVEIAAAPDIRRLRIAARLEVWRAVVQTTVGDVDFEGDDRAEKESQRHSQAKAMLALAETALARYDAGTGVGGAGAAATSTSLSTQAVW